MYDDMEAFDRIERQHIAYARQLAEAKLSKLNVAELRALYRHYTKEGAGRILKAELIEIVADFYVDDREHNPDALDY